MLASRFAFKTSPTYPLHATADIPAAVRHGVSAKAFPPPVAAYKAVRPARRLAGMTKTVFQELYKRRYFRFPFAPEMLFKVVFATSRAARISSWLLSLISWAKLWAAL